MEDALRASEDETRSVLAKSLHTWETYSRLTDGNELLPYDCVRLRAVLGHVPAFLGVNLPDHPLLHNLEHIDCETTEELWITGKSNWRTTIGDCNLPEKVLSSKLLLGLSSGTLCCFTEENRFRDWPGVENIEKPVKGNCIAVYDKLNKKEAATLAQLRMGMARINGYLHRIGVSETDRCDCGAAKETVKHFLLLCTRWDHLRAHLLQHLEMRIGDISFCLGGRSKNQELDPSPWKPNMNVQANASEGQIPSLLC